jgi:hypothetical protein
MKEANEANEANEVNEVKEVKEKRTSSHKKRAMENRTSIRRRVRDAKPALRRLCSE